MSGTLPPETINLSISFVEKAFRDIASRTTASMSPSCLPTQNNFNEALDTVADRIAEINAIIARDFPNPSKRSAK